MTRGGKLLVRGRFDKAAIVTLPITAGVSTIAVGEMAICDLRLYRVIAIDRYGFCTLADAEGETIMRHQRDEELTDPFLRAWANCLADRFDE
jgi:hypothetical protein